ncbi:Ribokinase [Candida viswanathii]|uniref:Ribokinase n=1 Tax=Candida viswanathii TaxID=5486 RepID=A0A367YDW3_9ASCO|nr:Ribokinase [Candida viswanathii]
MSSNPTVTIIGSLNYDLVTFTKKVPDAGETFQAHTFETHMGGKGLNEAIAVSKLSPRHGQSIETRMIGKIGTDPFGTQLKQCLVDNGVNVEHVGTVEGSSGVAVILVEEDSGENRILITPGSNGELKPSEEEYERYFPSDDDSFVVLQNEYPDTVKTVEWLKKNRASVNIAYNPSPFKPEWITGDLLSKIDLLIVNEGEALDVAKHLGLLEAIPESAEDEVEKFTALAKSLKDSINQDNVNTVIITMGSKGCVYVSKSINAPDFIKSKKVEKVIDTTGAGDTFFGGVVLNLALGKDIKEAVQFATTASSLAIQKKGAAEGIPSYDDVIANL